MANLVAAKAISSVYSSPNAVCLLPSCTLQHACREAACILNVCPSNIHNSNTYCRGAAPIALHLTCAGLTHNQGKGMDQKWDTKFSANICAINFKQDQIVAKTWFACLRRDDCVSILRRMSVFFIPSHLYQKDSSTRIGIFASYLFSFWRTNSWLTQKVVPCLL